MPDQFLQMILLKLIFSLIILNSTLSMAEERLYLNPDSGPLPVYSRPGQNDENCPIDDTSCNVYLNSETQIIKIPNTLVKTIDEIDIKGSTGKVNYVKVKYQTTREIVTKNKMGQKTSKIETVFVEGWMNGSLLYTQPIVSSWKSREILNNPNLRADSCINGVNPQRISSGKIQVLNQSNADMADFALDESVNKLKNIVGHCPLKPIVKKKPDWKDKEVYETEALPLLKQNLKKLNNLDLPKMITKNDIAMATHQDIYDIDVLARTIYAEMAECLVENPEYGKAVAKVALNRARQVKEGTAYPHFSHTRTGQKRNLPELSRVLLAKNQFSLWNIKTGLKDQSILLALCPSRDNSNKNWSNRQASPADQTAWSNALRIATEAVLFRPYFESKTKEVTQLYFTSKMDNYDGREKANVRILTGNSYQPISNSQCLTLWDGK